MPLRFSGSVWCALLVALAFATAPALADGGHGGDRRDARVAGTCSKGATSELRLRARDGSIRVEFRVRRRRAGEAWRVVLVHERRVAWRGAVRTSGSDGSFRVQRSLVDLDGPDQVSARASGPNGSTCESSAMLTG